MEDVDSPGGGEREACSAAVYAARDYLREHGPAAENEITEGLGHRNARIVRPTLARLPRTGTVDREDCDDGATLFGLG